MKSPHRAMALRGLLYCAAILIKKFLVNGNVEIMSGAEKSMVLPDCRVVFLHQFRGGERYFYLLEQQILKMVRTGDAEGLKKWTSNAPAVNGGILASEQLRQAKNTLVVLATLVSRAAIQGGMEADEAFSLSDVFIQRSERFNDLQQITVPTSVSHRRAIFQGYSESTPVKLRRNTGINISDNADRKSYTICVFPLT